MTANKIKPVLLSALFTIFWYIPINAIANIVWTPAGQLAQSNILKTANGKTINVMSVKKKIGTRLMYNLTINHNHDFFIFSRNAEVLVHNCENRFVYRWDSRPPKIIMEEGFEGTTNNFEFNIFDSKTVFASNDQIGSQSYLNEIGSIRGAGGVEDILPEDLVGKTFYLYKIRLGSEIRIFESFKKVMTKPFVNNMLRSKIYRTNGRRPYLNVFKHHSFELTEGLDDAYENAIRRWLTLSQKNKEIQLEGPIKKGDIKYLFSRKITSGDEPYFDGTEVW